MDELTSGIDPTEIKLYVDKFKEINNARMTFDKLSLSSTYQLVIGEAGESWVFYIAESLGMPKDMLATAEKVAYQQLI